MQMGSGGFLYGTPWISARVQHMGEDFGRGHFFARSAWPAGRGNLSPSGHAAVGSKSNTYILWRRAQKCISMRKAAHAINQPFHPSVYPNDARVGKKRRVFQRCQFKVSYFQASIINIQRAGAQKQRKVMVLWSWRPLRLSFSPSFSLSLCRSPRGADNAPRQFNMRILRTVAQNFHENAPATTNYEPTSVVNLDKYYTRCCVHYDVVALCAGETQFYVSATLVKLFFCKVQGEPINKA